MVYSDVDAIVKRREYPFSYGKDGGTAEKFA
jgi:hypothetical protein